MQNSKTKAQAHQLCIEVVPQQESRDENYYFAIAILLVVGIAAALLIFTTTTKTQKQRLPNELVNLVTQLQNSKTEIAVLQDMAVLSLEPSLDALIAHELPPFNTVQFKQLAVSCFVAEHSNHKIRFAKFANQWRVNWMKIQQHGHEHSLNKANCENSSEWLSADLATE